jgi:hypothetical protein
MSRRAVCGRRTAGMASQGCFVVVVVVAKLRVHCTLLGVTIHCLLTEKVEGSTKASFLRTTTDECLHEQRNIMDNIDSSF